MIQQLAANPLEKFLVYQEREVLRTLRNIEGQERQVNILLQKTARDIVDLGVRLLEIEQRLGSSHKFWAWWRDFADREGVTLCYRTIYEYRLVGKKFGHLLEAEQPILDNIKVSAITLLSLPKYPKQAFQEALSIAESGEIVDFTAARNLQQGVKPDTLLKEKQTPRKITRLVQQAIQALGADEFERRLQSLLSEVGNG